MVDVDEFIPFIRNQKIIKIGRSSRSLTDDEGLFFLRYNSQRNLYDSSLNEYCREGWSNLTYYAECIDWNHENGHDMSYLKRTDGCPLETPGIIHWRFDISGIRDWRRIEIFVGGKLWRKTSIDLDLILKSCDYCGHKRKKRMKLNEKFVLFDEDRMKDMKYLDLVATLMGGGRDDVDPNHLRPQLFRTHDRDSEWLFLFKVF